MQVVVLSLGCVRQGSRYYAFLSHLLETHLWITPSTSKPCANSKNKAGGEGVFYQRRPSYPRASFFCLLRYEVRQTDINSAEMPARSHSAYTIFFSVFRRANHVSTLKCLSKYRTMNSIALALSTSIGEPAVHFCLWFPSLTRWKSLNYDHLWDTFFKILATIAYFDRTV